MRIRWSVIVVIGLLLVPPAAYANDHTADFFGAPSWAGGSLLSGFHGSFGVTIPTGRTARHLSGLGDLSVHFGSHKDVDVTRVTALGGLRWWLPSGGHTSAPFLQGAIGTVNDSAGADEGTHFSAAFGAGWDYVPRGTADGWAVRVQVDYVISKDDFPRVSTGLVYRFKNP
jgi:hypothetical protein